MRTVAAMGAALARAQVAAVARPLCDTTQWRPRTFCASAWAPIAWRRRWVLQQQIDGLAQIALCCGQRIHSLLLGEAHADDLLDCAHIRHSVCGAIEWRVRRRRTAGVRR